MTEAIEKEKALLLWGYYPVHCRMLSSIPGVYALDVSSRWSCSVVFPTLCDPMDCSLPGSSVHGIFRQEYWSGMPFPSAGHLPNPGMEPRSPTLQADSLSSEPPGKPKSERESHSIMSDSLWPHGLYSPWKFPGQNSGVGSCSLL